jgi:LacI family transcriptional regulator
VAEDGEPPPGEATRVQRVRLKDVAAAAGVDPSTASRVLSGRSERVRRETARKVLAASRRLGYTPNAFARGLRTRTTRTIGLIIPDFDNPVYASVISGVEHRAGENEVSVVVRALRDGELDRHADLAWESRVDGLLFGALSEGTDALAQLERAGVPCVLINRSSPHAPASVVMDEAAGVRAGVRFLVDHGHRRIAFVAGPPTIDTAQRRRSGFDATMRELGLPVDKRFVVEAFEPEAARRATRTLFARGPGPTAIFAWTFKTALGVLHELYELGKRVPDDVSMIAMPDVWFAEHLWPPLTGVKMPLDAMGARGVDLLLSLVQGQPAERVVITTPAPRVVARASVGPPLPD